MQDAIERRVRRSALSYCSPQPLTRLVRLGRKLLSTGAKFNYLRRWMSTMLASAHHTKVSIADGAMEALSSSARNRTQISAQRPQD
jgi:hypothetical protein